MTTVQVIGAGVSGLTAAWQLADTGATVDVFESAPAEGGLVRTTRTGCGLAENAANAFVWTDRTERWFDRLKITPSFALDTSRRRFIYRNGRPRQWPLSPGETLRTAARVGMAVATRRTAPRDHETAEAWGRRVAGAVATRHLLAPALQGVYGVPLDRLSARAVFGPRKRQRVRLAAPAEGMGEFVQRLRAGLEARGVRIHCGQPIATIEAHTPTWICTNAPAAAHLLRPHAPEAANLIAKVQLTAMASVTAFYEPHASDEHGFGVLFPPGEGMSALGVRFNSDIFAGSAPFRSETWIYGGASPDALPTQENLPALLRADRYKLTGRDQQCAGIHIGYAPQAFPIYDYAIVALAALDTHLPAWLRVKGNYLGKRGVSDLI